VDKGLSLQTTLVYFFTLVALVLFSLVVANRLWLWLAPLPEASAPPALQPGYSMQSVYGLYGVPVDTTATSGLLPASTGLAFRLLGIVAAEGDGAAYAVVQIAPGDIVAVREGQDITPGVRLTAVNLNHLVLERAGTRETLSWPQP